MPRSEFVTMTKSESAILTLMVVSFFAGIFYQQHKLVPPSNVVTLAEFSATMPPPQKVIAFEKNGSAYVEIVGPLPGFPTVPSGPPAYIFDSSGRIAYWTGDTGDSTEYWDNWQNRSKTREISLCEALRWFAAARIAKFP